MRSYPPHIHICIAGIDYKQEFFVGGAIDHVIVDDSGQYYYTGLWALSREDEKRNLEHFVDWVIDRWRQYPDLHIYHFAPYEPGALKRLMGRYASREEEIDRMLRAGLFVDLFGVARRGIRAGVENYSLKELEQFYGFERSVGLPEANRALAETLRRGAFGLQG